MKIPPTATGKGVNLREGRKIRQGGEGRDVSLPVTFPCVGKARWALRRQESEGILAWLFLRLSRQEATNLVCPQSSDFIQVNAKS